MLKINYDIIEKESDRFWSRNNILLLIQAAFIAFFADISDKNSVYKILLSIQGLVFAFVWIGILRKGSFYVQRWDETIRRLEFQLERQYGGSFKGLKRLNDIAKKRELKPNIFIRSLNKRTTKLIKVIIYNILIFWLIVLIISSLEYFQISIDHLFSLLKP